jgi:hypothetical protein
MILGNLLSAAIEASIGLLAEVGLGDEIRDLKDQLTNTPELKQREPLDRALARAREAVGDNTITPLFEHRPFLEEMVKPLLDPTHGFGVELVGKVWQECLPQHGRALRRFFTILEECLYADKTWGPILDRYQQCRFRREVQEWSQLRDQLGDW